MQPYVPNQLPLDTINFKKLFGLVGQANAELARYDGLLQGIVNPAILLSPLTTQEAVLSSKIEGTQATVDEVLEHEAGIQKEGEKSQDIQEVINYRAALFSSADYLKDRPINLHMIREMHHVLLDSVRGQDKTPGEFRKDQNWIGKHGTPIEEATFVPPSPLQLNDHLQALERYLEFDDVDHLLQTSIIHAQFELIHPFKDGNGRIGRILIPLFLYQKKKLSQPMFYLSSYLERNREEYYIRLQGISRDNGWNDWIEFFLIAIIEQVQENSEKVRGIMALYDDMKRKIVDLTRSQYAIKVLDALFYKPIFQTSDFVARTGIPKQTAMPLLRTLKENNLLNTVRESSGRRAGVMAFSELLNIAEGRKIL
jgi:Fic family protein